MGSQLSGVQKLLERPIATVAAWMLAQIGVIVAFLGFFGITASSAYLPAFLWLLVSFCIAWGVWFSYSIYNHNSRLINCAHEFHQINHIYRDAICGRLFDPLTKDAVFTDSELIQNEKLILNHVCTKIASIFRFLTNRKCFVSVYLVRDVEGQDVCSLHAFGEFEANRNKVPAESFTVNARNTRFFSSLDKKTSGVCFFYSADLEKHVDYYDQIQHYTSDYKSCIVVPIRYCPNRENADPDDIGFLVVDTLYTHRLNDTFHVQYLAAFADQMYNFQNIWRLR